MCLSDRNFGHRIFGKIRAVLLRFALAMLFFSLWVLFVSCSSLPSATESRQFPEQKTSYVLCGEEISVSLNLVEDRELASQAGQIARAVLAEYLDLDEEADAGENDGKNALLLKITINQRTVPVGFNSFNSLYLNCSLEDADGKSVLNRCIFKKTKKTVESGKFLYSQVKECCGSVKKFLKKAEKI